MRSLATIGVYGFTAEDFLAALITAEVRLLVDVRQRRGVRGPEYAWANSKRLQGALADAGIGYEHRPDVAPTTELRQLQYAEDDRRGEGKRNRTVLASAYVERYEREILAAADVGSLVAAMPPEGATALLCVERDPEACHRLLIARRLEGEYGLKATHLRP